MGPDRERRLQLTLSQNLESIVQPLDEAALQQEFGVTASAGSNFARSRRLTTANRFLKMFVNPRLGSRRWSGIWPPSKPGRIREPARDRCPFAPRVAVLPWPEPIP